MDGFQEKLYVAFTRTNIATTTSITSATPTTSTTYNTSTPTISAITYTISVIYACIATSATNTYSNYF